MECVARSGSRGGRSWHSTAADEQRRRLAARTDPDRALTTARSESAAEFLCAELTARGLPFDVVEAERIIAAAIGPRPRGTPTPNGRSGRGTSSSCNISGPAPRSICGTLSDVRAMLRRVGVDVPNTRAGQLEQHRDAHPVVEALLTWRKAERIATTYGYRWLDEHVAGGRLRGAWTSSDGAAGRMTASSGLHNLPADLRSAVAAEDGCVLVRADLGQIEPRVLAAVSGDEALIAATREDDLYQPVASRLQVTRDKAKVAVLAAMYGATTGTSAQALHGLERAYPTAMAVLEQAAAAGRAGEDVYTLGGRRVRMWVDDSVEGDIDRARQRCRGARAIRTKRTDPGRRRRVLQGVGGDGAGSDGDGRCRDRAVPARRAARAVPPRRLPRRWRRWWSARCAESAARWSPHRDVRFVADVSVVGRWSDVT